MVDPPPACKALLACPQRGGVWGGACVGARLVPPLGGGSICLSDPPRKGQELRGALERWPLALVAPGDLEAVQGGQIGPPADRVAEDGPHEDVERLVLVEGEVDRGPD